MVNDILGAKIVAETNLWEFINNDPEFNEFVGKCVTHFLHFVVPRRDCTKKISEKYEVPERFTDAVGHDWVVLARKDSKNEVFIEFLRFADETDLLMKGEIFYG